MVFQKLSTTDREQLAIYAQDHDKKVVAAMRALIMRGASPNEAKAMATERASAKNSMMEQILKEKQQRDEEDAEAAKPKRGRKPKVKSEPEPETEAIDPKPKPKRGGKTKATEANEQLEKDIPTEITILA